MEIVESETEKGGDKMPEVGCLRVVRGERSNGVIKIYPLAYLVIIDREEGYFEEKTYVEIDLDADTDEIIDAKIKEALKWTSTSRKRFERAKEIAKRYNVPLEVEVAEDC